PGAVNGGVPPAQGGGPGLPAAPGAGWQGQPGDPAGGAMPGGDGEVGLGGQAPRAPSQTDQASLPPTQPSPVRVDLLPQSYRDKIVLAKAQRRAVMIVLIALLVVAVGYVVGLLRVGSATEARNEALQQQAQAQAAVNKLSEVPKTQAKVAELKENLKSVMGNEVLFSALTAETLAALPAGTVMSSLGWTLSTDKSAAASTAAAKSGASATASVGSMKLEGCTPAFVGTVAVIEGLAKVPTLANVWLDSAASGETCGPGSYDFASTGDVAPSAVSGRYAAPDGAK
ncbi:MAG: hypothetical protein RLZ55_9, partial [Actinomycetota bacterium]